MPKYGLPPVNLGTLDMSPVEMMFWLYCPVKMIGSVAMTIPPNLEQYQPMLERVKDDCRERWRESYVYLTAKVLFVTKENPGGRPGWHSDGFMTDDLNYVWSDRDGTLFWIPIDTTDFIQDHDASLAEMSSAASLGPLKTYPDKSLLRLDETVIHRITDIESPGIRSFVKVSVSRHKYNLVGNSINHLLPNDWYFIARSEERNPPTFESSSAEHADGEGKQAGGSARLPGLQPGGVA